MLRRVPGVEGRFEERAGLAVLTFPLLDGRGVDAVVTTTGGGTSTGPYESLNLGILTDDDAPDDSAFPLWPGRMF